MFICLKCNAVFSEPDEAVVDRYPAGEEMAPRYGSVCPACGNDEIAEAVQCDICGEWYDKSELNEINGETICDECLCSMNTEII